MLIVDSYCHILPKKYQEALERLLPNRDRSLNTMRYAESVPTLLDLEARFRLMDRFEGYVQVLSIAYPSITRVASPEVAVDLAKFANDELAELVHRYPERFVAGIACVPLNNVEGALKEVDRAIRDLRLRGAEVYSDVGGKPLDSPEFLPFYRKMAEYNLPIFIHPQKEATQPDYASESQSKYRLWTKLGWPYATAAAMTRLVCGGILEQVPGINFVVHHCGGAIPFLAGRLAWNDDFNESRMGHRDILLNRPVLDYFRMFHYDTAVNGNTAALRCGLEFAGVGQMVFASDMPFDNESGSRLIRDTIDSIENLGLSEADKKSVYYRNAAKLMRLPISPF
jgi:predicted TIM-barrel fold metal-dependent hydrolase